MSGLDTVLMSDLEIWITLALAAAAGLLIEIMPDFGRLHGALAKVTLSAMLALAAMAAVAWHGIPAHQAPGSIVADAGHS